MLLSKCVHPSAPPTALRPLTVVPSSVPSTLVLFKSLPLIGCRSISISQNQQFLFLFFMLLRVWFWVLQCLHACTVCSVGLLQVPLDYSLLGSLCRIHSIPGVVSSLSVCSYYPLWEDDLFYWLDYAKDWKYSWVFYDKIILFLRVKI